MNLGTQTFICSRWSPGQHLQERHPITPKGRNLLFHPTHRWRLAVPPGCPGLRCGPRCGEGKAGGRCRHVLSSSRGGARSLGAGPNSHSCSLVCSQLCDAGRPAKYELQINHVDSGVETAHASYIRKKLLVYLNFTFNWSGTLSCSPRPRPASASPSFSFLLPRQCPPAETDDSRRHRGRAQGSPAQPGGEALGCPPCVPDARETTR